MLESYIINPYCFKYCSFNAVLVSGVVIGMAIMTIVLICIQIVNNVSSMHSEEEEIEVEPIMINGRKYWRDIKSNTLYTNEEGNEIGKVVEGESAAEAVEAVEAVEAEEAEEAEEAVEAVAEEKSNENKKDD